MHIYNIHVHLQYKQKLQIKSSKLFFTTNNEPPNIEMKIKTCKLQNTKNKAHRKRRKEQISATTCQKSLIFLTTHFTTYTCVYKNETQKIKSKQIKSSFPQKTLPFAKKKKNK